LIFELLEQPSEYPKYFVRIYERRSLDAKIRSKQVYMYIKGEYVLKNNKGEDLDNEEESKED
jgi:hypothetical protein